jgi:hypothetical protein
MDGHDLVAWGKDAQSARRINFARPHVMISPYHQNRIIPHAGRIAGLAATRVHEFLSGPIGGAQVADMMPKSMAGSKFAWALSNAWMDRVAERAIERQPTNYPCPLDTHENVRGRSEVG